MKIINNIKTFIYDKDYFVNVYDNKIHIYQYIDLLKLSEEEIIFKLSDFTLYISGSNLHIIKMASNELMIEGVLGNMEFKR